MCTGDVVRMVCVDGVLEWFCNGVGQGSGSIMIFCEGGRRSGCCTLFSHPASRQKNAVRGTAAPVWRRPSRGYSFKGCKTALLRRADAFVAWAHWDETAHSLLALKLLATAMSQFNIHYNNTTGSGKPKTRSKISKYWAATLLPVHALQRINSRVPTTHCVPALTEGYPASPLLTAGCSATPPHRAATRPLQ